LADFATGNRIQPFDPNNGPGDWFRDLDEFISALKA
jgi:hypothetical protein